MVKINAKGEENIAKFLAKQKQFVAKFVLLHVDGSYASFGADPIELEKKFWREFYHLDYEIWRISDGRGRRLKENSFVPKTLKLMTKEELEARAAARAATEGDQGL